MNAILCSLSTLILQTILEILRLKVKKEVLTKLQFLFLLSGLVSELEESQRFAQICLISYALCFPQQIWTYIVLVGSSVASLVVRYGSDFTIAQGISCLLYTLLMAYLISLVKKSVNDFKEVKQCICKEPTPREEEIMEKTPPQIKISHD